MDLTAAKRSATITPYVEMCYIYGINRDIYMEFLHDVNTNADYAASLSRYLLHKHYNSTFGDVVPLIIANALSITLRIKDCDSQNEVNDVIINPMVGHSQHSLTIHRAADHFSGINIIPCVVKSPTFANIRKPSERIGKPSHVQPIKYSKSELLNLNSSSFGVKRQVRKTLFKNDLWQPKTHRDADSSALNSSSAVPTL
jgi:hypothetical protein